MPALSPTMIEKLQGLSPEDLQKVLRLVDTLALSRDNGPAPDPNDLDEDVRPWRGVFEIDSQRRDEIPLSLSSGEPLPPCDQPFDILWDPNRHDD